MYPAATTKGVEENDKHKSLILTSTGWRNIPNHLRGHHQTATQESVPRALHTEEAAERRNHAELVEEKANAVGRIISW